MVTELPHRDKSSVNSIPFSALRSFYPSAGSVLPGPARSCPAAIGTLTVMDLGRCAGCQPVRVIHVFGVLSTSSGVRPRARGLARGLRAW